MGNYGTFADNPKKGSIPQIYNISPDVWAHKILPYLVNFLELLPTSYDGRQAYKNLQLVSRELFAKITECFNDDRSKIMSQLLSKQHEFFKTAYLDLISDNNCYSATETLRMQAVLKKYKFSMKNMQLKNPSNFRQYNAIRSALKKIENWGMHKIPLSEVFETSDEFDLNEDYDTSSEMCTRCMGWVFIECIFKTILIISAPLREVPALIVNKLQTGINPATKWILPLYSLVHSLSKRFDCGIISIIIMLIALAADLLSLLCLLSCICSMPGTFYDMCCRPFDSHREFFGLCSSLRSRLHSFFSEKNTIKELRRIVNQDSRYGWKLQATKKNQNPIRHSSQFYSQNFV